MTVQKNPQRDPSTGGPKRFMPDYVLEDQVGHLLRRANQRHAAIFFNGLNDHQLTPTQFAALVKVGDEQEVSQNQLGRLTAMDQATIFGVVKRLRERGLVDARPDPGDARRSLLRLSAAGKCALEDAVPMAKQITMDTLAPLAAGERRTLLKLLRKLS